jgi:hypothetical protein
MARYRFEIRQREQTETLWIELADSEAARKEAMTSARELLIDAAIEGHDRRAWVTRVFDEAGYTIATVTFADLLASPES